MRAITRSIGPAYRDALGQDAGYAIDLALAERQHAAYVATLRQLGVAVTVLPEGGFADGCFVEDTAIIIGGQALVTRPGAPSRRAETEAIADALLTLGLHVTTMHEPALLDGGDVLRMANKLFVGRSARTNEAGIQQLAAWTAPLGHAVIVVDVPPATLHLKCHATAPVPGLLVRARHALPDSWVPNDWDTIDLPDAEAYAANTLGIDQTIIIAAGYPETMKRIAATGRPVIALDTTEIAKAAGSLTCLSLLVES